MRIDIITVLPEMLESPLNCSILKRAQKKGLAEIVVHDLRDYTLDKHRRVDDYPFGGEAGMVMQIEPVDRCISHLKEQRDYDEVIFVTPDGEKFDQRMANTLSLSENLIILCGHYKGIDYRIREQFVTREITIGDYVLTGGELPAAIITDAIVRLIPGAIGDEQSALSDSFQDNLLAPPVYTRPAVYKGWSVPDVLLSGHQAKIDEWKHEMALRRTMELRPDLLAEKRIGVMGVFGKIKGLLKKINFFFIIIVVFGVYITFFSDYNYMRVLDYEREIKELKSEIKASQDSCRIYQERLRKLGSDPETLERIVREEYRMKRDNEDLYMVND